MPLSEWAASTIWIIRMMIIITPFRGLDPQAHNPGPRLDNPSHDVPLTCVRWS